MEGRGPLRTAGSQRRAWIVFIVKAPITVAIVAFMLSRLDFERVHEVMAATDGRILIPAVAVLALQPMLHAGAWFVLLRAARSATPFPKVLRITLISLFFNQIIPASLGGIGMRIVLGVREGVPVSVAASTVVAERVVFLFGYVALAIVTFPVFADLFGGGPDTLYLAFLSAMFPAGALALWQGPRLTRLWHRIPVLGRASKMILGLRGLFLKPLDIGVCFVLILAYHGLSFFAVWLITLAMGVGIETGTLISLLPHVFLIAIVPISVNGWGVREAAMVGLLSMAGVDAEAAFMISVAFGIGILLTRLPLGALWIVPRRDVERAA